MGLSDGRKSFRIRLAVLIQYRSVTDTQPASQPRCRSYYAPRSGVEPKTQLSSSLIRHQSHKLISLTSACHLSGVTSNIGPTYSTRHNHDKQCTEFLHPQSESRYWPLANICISFRTLTQKEFKALVTKFETT